MGIPVAILSELKSKSFSLKLFFDSEKKIYTTLTGLSVLTKTTRET